MQPCLATQATHVNARTHFQPSNQLSCSHRLPSLTDTFEKSKSGLMTKHSLHTKEKLHNQLPVWAQESITGWKLGWRVCIKYQALLGKPQTWPKSLGKSTGQRAWGLGRLSGWLIFDSLNRQRIQIESADTSLDRQTERASYVPKSAGWVRAGFRRDTLKPAAEMARDEIAGHHCGRCLGFRGECRADCGKSALLQTSWPPWASYSTFEPPWITMRAPS